MHTKRRVVVIYGGSCFLAGICASLETHPDLDVITVTSPPEAAATTIAALQPQVVLTEDAQTPALLPLLYLQPSLPVIGLNTTESALTVLRGRAYPVETIAELEHIIAHI